MYNLMITGEATNRISKIDKSVLQEFPGLSLSVPTHNALIHGYAVGDDAVVWHIASALLSPLRDLILDYINGADSPEWRGIWPPFPKVAEILPFPGAS
jgi:uncharacterized protein with HEPN domain